MPNLRIDQFTQTSVVNTDVAPVSAPNNGPAYKATLAQIVAAGLNQPNSASAGAGANITLKAPDGVTSGAGGSWIIRPGAQATTGGNGSIWFQDSGGANRLQFQNTSIFLDNSGAGTNGNIAGLGSASVSMTADTYYVRNTVWFGSGSVSAGIVQVGNGGQNILQVNNFAGTDGSSFAFKPSSPTSLAANTDNLALSSSAVQRLNASGAFNLTGIAPPSGASAHVAGRVIYLINVSASNTITLVHQATSTATNQFLSTTGANLALGPNRIALCIYDDTTQRWRTTLLP